MTEHQPPEELKSRHAQAKRNADKTFHRLIGDPNNEKLAKDAALARMKLSEVELSMEAAQLNAVTRKTKSEFAELHERAKDIPARFQTRHRDLQQVDEALDILCGAWAGLHDDEFGRDDFRDLGVPRDKVELLSNNLVRRRIDERLKHSGVLADDRSFKTPPEPCAALADVHPVIWDMIVEELEIDILIPNPKNPNGGGDE